MASVVGIFELKLLHGVGDDLIGNAEAVLPGIGNRMLVAHDPHLAFRMRSAAGAP